jgi:peptidoglycan/LPS O-acetylase OafA/YrhL
MMFFSMLIGVWAALAAIAARRETRVGAWVALAGITAGGMILGPIVQKYAFAAYWTGWPLGSDLTDNKTAAIWLAWIIAVAVLQRRPDRTDRIARTAVVLAALVMLAAFVVPHSLRGSQHDYRAASTVPVPSASPAPGQ